jgi:hypothetical protein
MPKLIQGSCIHPDIGENPTQVHVLPTPVHQDATGTGNLPRRLQPAMPFFNRDTVRFVGVSFQFGLLVLLIRQFELERGPLGDVMLLAWIGFAIHHFLPGRLRLPFFTILSMASVPLAIGLPLGGFVLGAGLVLIGLCHMRRPFWQCALAVSAFMFLLLVLRMTRYAPPIVVIGSMFMFRLIVYLHDLKNRAAPRDWIRAIAYFFMVPNVCFPLFPLVDYKRFCTTYDNNCKPQVYQTGVRWMFRGLVQLLLYRVVNQLLQGDPLRINDLGGVARFMMTTYLLYLRVSGSFHLIIGMLHLFGFNLPETNHRYMLASSFTDLCRRLNIYWKDFILKIFFYPAYFHIKHWGRRRALAAAIVFAFLATWLLHAYQILWLRGTRFLTWQDALVWLALGSLVLVNALLEAQRGRQRTLHNPTRTFYGELGHALRTIGTFLVICTLWTVGSAESSDELMRLAAAARNVTLPSLAAIVAVLMGLGVAGVFFGRSTYEHMQASEQPERAWEGFAFWRSAGFVTAGTLALLLFGESYRLSAANDTLYGDIVISLRSDRFHEIEFTGRTRGYYENLDVIREDPLVRMALQPGSWWPAKKLHRENKSFLLHEPIPDVSHNVHGITVTYNSYGLRGPLYEAKKAPGVFRIAVVGASIDAGRCVNDDETFVHLLEQHLNRDDVNEQIHKFELWNFSVEGYGAIQKLMVVEQKALAFKPDLILWFTYGPEAQRTGDQLADALLGGYEAPAPFDQLTKAIFEKAHIDASMSKSRIERLLRPYTPELVDRVFQRFAELCRLHKTRGCLVYRPQPRESVRLQGGQRLEVIRSGEKAGLPILDLTGCFSAVADRESVMVAPKTSFQWRSFRREPADDHPNAAGHQLIEGALYDRLHTAEGKALMKQWETKADEES